MAALAVWSDEARSGIWHLGDDDNPGLTMCGMNTEYLKRGRNSLVGYRKTMRNVQVAGYSAAESLMRTY